jgi:hypothetical protein
MITLTYKASPALTYEQLLDHLSDDEFKNKKQDLERSSLAVVEYWGLQPDTRLAHLCAGIRAPYCIDSQLGFEHEVKSAPSTGSGGNRASCTDVLVDNQVAPIAIEGKRAEGLYKTVARWLGKQPSPNKQNVRDHWLDMIEAFAPNLDRNLVSAIEYQKVHRCASSCHAASHRGVATARLVYEVFDPANARQDFRRELLDFKVMLGSGARIEIWLHEVELRPTVHHNPTNVAMVGRQGKPERAAFLRQEMKRARLFDFPMDKFTQI